jgi:hypothetical protein
MKIKSVVFIIVAVFLMSGSASAWWCAPPSPYLVPQQNYTHVDCMPILTENGPSAVKADAFIFTPTDPDLRDLDHNYVYYWGIDVTKAINNDGFNRNEITYATVTFVNIYDWMKEPNDVLWLNLLTGTPTNLGTPVSNSSSADGMQDVIVWQDNQNPSNKFSGANVANILVDKWNDPNGGAPTSPPTNLTFDIPVATLIAYLADNKFGLGIDPDCHYYNDRVVLTIYTEECKVPEPGTLPMLLGSALAGLAFFGRRKK